MPKDFLRILGDLTDYVENEKAAAYNEAVDMMIGNTRDWMLMNGIPPKAKNLPDLLDEIKAELSPEDHPSE